MTISMHQISIPVCNRFLDNLEHILQKGETYAKEKKIDETVILGSRLSLDMLPLIKQVQISSDTCKGVGARLSGLDNPKYEDSEKTFVELYQRLDKTREFLTSIPAEKLAGSEDREVVVNLPNLEMKFRGIDYLMGFALPNLAFHVSTAYGILRHNGVPLGKQDFLGNVPRQ